MSHIRLGTINSNDVLYVNQPLTSQSITIQATSDSTSHSTGSLVVFGGMGIGKTLTAGGNLTFATPTLADASIISLNTTLGNDNKSLTLTAFGSTNTASNRGAYLTLRGKDVNQGEALLGSTHSIQFLTGATPSTTMVLSETGTVTISRTTESTSHTTGAMVIAGGLGIAGAVYSNSHIRTTATSALEAGYLTVTGTTMSTMQGVLSIENTTTSTSTSTGALLVAGGIATQGNVHAGGTVVSPLLSITATNESTSTSTGAAIVSGGMGVGGTLTANALKAVTVTGTLSTAAQPNVVSLGTLTGLTVSGTVAITQTDNAVDATSGALRVSGGVSIAKDMYTGGKITAHDQLMVQSTSNATIVLNSNTDETDNDVSRLVFQRNGVDKADLQVDEATADSPLDINGVVATGIAMVRGGGNVGIGTLPSTTRKLSVSGSCTIASTESATNTTSGALIIQGGGLAVQGNAHIGATLVIHDTSNATSTATGSVRLSGGIAVTGASYYAATLSAQALINRSAVFTLGTTATAEGDSGASRALVKTASNTLTLNYAKDFSGGTIIDGVTTNLVGNVLIGSATNDVRNMDFPAGTTSAYIFNAHTALGNGINVSYNALNNNTAWTVTDALQGTSRMHLSNGTISFYTGDMNASPTTTQLTIEHTMSTFYSPVSLTNTLVLTDTTEATNLTSGSLVTHGGSAIAKQLYVGGATVLQNTLNVTGETSVYGITQLANTTDSTSSTNGSLIVSGGTGIAKNATIGGNLHVAGTSMFVDNTTFVSPIMLQDTTESVDISTGALVLMGGLAVQKSISVGAHAEVEGNASVAGILSVINTAESFTSATGALVVSGGQGIAKNLRVGGSVYVASDIVTSGNTSTTGTAAIGTNVLTGDLSGTLLVRSANPGLRVAALDANKTPQYANSLMLFSFGNALTDTNHEALQLSSTGTTAFTILTRAGGTGVTRNLMLQAGGTNTGQVTLYSDGTTILPLAKTVGASDNPTNPEDGALNLTSGDMTIGNHLVFTRASGTANPSYTLRSAGTKIVLYPNIGPASTDTAIGTNNTEDLWLASQGTIRFYAGTTATFAVDNTGNVSYVGNASHTGSLSITAGQADTVRLAPSTAGNTVATVYAYDATMTKTSTDGHIWYVGRNVMNQGQTTFGIATDGPSGETVTLWINNAGNVHITSTADSSALGNGALQIAGGVSIMKSVNIGGDLSVTGTIVGAIASTEAHLTSTDDATSTTTGSFTTAGGVGIAKKLYVGGQTYLQSGLQVTGNVTVTGSHSVQGALVVSDTTESSSTTTGSVLIGGGVGIAKNANIGGNVTLNEQLTFADGAALTNVAGAALRVVPSSSGLQVRNSLNTTTLLSITDNGPINATLQVTVTATGNSTSHASGALVVSGGVGLAGTLHGGEGAVFRNTVQVNTTGESVFFGGTSTSTQGGSGALIASTSLLYPSISASTTLSHCIGVSRTNNNAAYFGFNYVGASSTSNFATIGLHGQLDTLNVFGSGRVAIGSTTSPSTKFHVQGTSSFSGTINVSDTTNASSTTTGAMVVAGGMGIGKDVNIGGTLTVTNAVTSQASWTTSGVLTILDTTETVSLGQGSLVTSGGVSIARSARVGNELTVVGGTYIAALTATGYVSLTNTTASTSTTTGAVVIAGGIGIGGSVNVAGDVTLSSSSTMSSAYVRATENIESTSTTTGTMTTAGGMGIEKRLNVGGQVTVFNTTNSTGALTGALVVHGGASVSSSAYVGGDLTVMGSSSGVSDMRLKENIQDLHMEDVAQRIAKIKLKSFNFKDDPTKQRHIGVMAQELKEVFPDLVKLNGNGYYSVDYAKMSLYLIMLMQTMLSQS